MCVRNLLVNFEQFRAPRFPFCATEELGEDGIYCPPFRVRCRPHLAVNPILVIRYFAARRPPAKTQQTVVCPVLKQGQVGRVGFIAVSVERVIGEAHRPNLAPSSQIVLRAGLNIMCAVPISPCRCLATITSRRFLALCRASSHLAHNSASLPSGCSRSR